MYQNKMLKEKKKPKKKQTENISHIQEDKETLTHKIQMSILKEVNMQYINASTFIHKVNEKLSETDSHIIKNTSITFIFDSDISLSDLRKYECNFINNITRYLLSKKLNENYFMKNYLVFTFALTGIHSEISKKDQEYIITVEEFEKETET
jgi:hypothetical protein